MVNKLPMPNSFRSLSPLTVYQRLAQLSDQILDYISQERWASAAELCHLYADILEQLKDIPGLTQEQKRARRRLLGTILNNDAVIRARLYPNSHIFQHIYKAGGFTKPNNMQHSLH